MSFAAPITIAKAIGDISRGNYVLPAIQREFVWSAGQIERLFDSLMRGYPFGSFLFWQIRPENLEEFQFYRFMDRYHQRDERHNQPLNLKGRHESVIAVLDGQQRLTALNIGLRGTYANKLPYYNWSSDHAFPERRLCLNLIGSADEESEMAFEFRMLRMDNEVTEQLTDGGKYWFPVSKILDFEKGFEAYKYCIRRGLTEDGETFAGDTLAELHSVIHEKRLINYFLEEEQNLDKVLNIFIRVNSGGTVLSYSDMLLSIATAQWEEKDARKEVYNLVDSLNDIGEGFNFSKDFILKSSLVLSDAQAIEFRVNSFNRQNMLNIEAQWEGIKQALLQTTRLLYSWGFNSQTLVSTNAVIPLAYYLYKKGNHPTFIEAGQFQEDRKKMLRWLQIALLKRVFSGTPDNVLRQIRRAMAGKNNSFPAEDIYTALRGTAKSMDFVRADLEGLLNYRYQEKYTFSVLAMLYPWLKFDQKFHLDHIFPRSKFSEKHLREQGIPEDQWQFYWDNRDSLANLQLLQGIPNQEKSDKAFEEWLMGYCPEPEDLTSYRMLHLIPDVPISFDNFPEFIQAREKLLLERLAEILGVELGDDDLDTPTT